MISLFKREVPEVSDGTVAIMGVARDPGLRAKVAVYSKDREVDPVGACVGIRGSRIQNIVQELRGERIDIVVWSPDIAVYAQNGLSPARINRITVDDDENTLEVVVPDDQLTPAIGRKGQNVKLASKLLGWKIDVLTESRYGEMNASRQGLEQVASVAELSMSAFLAAGFESLDDLNNASSEDLMRISGMTESKISDLRAAINLLSPTRPAAEEGLAESEETVADEGATVDEEGTAAEASAEESPEIDAASESSDATPEQEPAEGDA
jgi:N utilization substance protein A